MDIKLNYIERGIGAPFILLHGNGESHSYFKHQIEYFSKSYRVIAIDTRGHGGSPRGTAPFSIKQFAEDLHDFLLSNEIEQAIILGFSDGGNIALTFALEYPEFVDKLILNGANLNPDGVKRFVQWPIEIGYKLASRAAKKNLNALKNAEMLGLMVNEPHILPEELKALTMPTFVIAGTNDIIMRCHTELIANSIQGAELAFIKGNHFVANKNPSDFNKCVEAFLT